MSSKNLWCTFNIVTRRVKYIVSSLNGEIFSAYRSSHSVVIHGCETWYITLREEFWLKVFENRILRRISEAKRDVNGSGEGSTTRNFIIYRSPNIVRMIKSRGIRWANRVLVARMTFLTEEEGKKNGDMDGLIAS